MRAHGLAPVLSVLLLSMSVAGARAQSSVRAVAIAGDPAPGGGTFEHFGVEALPIVAPANTKGQVAFFATILRSSASEAFFFASPTLSLGEGSARRKRMLGEQAEGPPEGVAKESIFLV